MVMSPHQRQDLFPQVSPILEANGAMVALLIGLRQCLAEIRDLRNCIAAEIEEVECEIIK